MPSRKDGEARSRPPLPQIAHLAAVPGERRRVWVAYLVDVNLTTGRPVGADHPESRPRAADGLGEVVELGDEETVGVRGLAAEAYAGAACVGGLELRVDADADVVGPGADQTHLLGRGLVLVVDPAAGRVDIIVAAGVVVALYHMVSPRVFLGPIFLDGRRTSKKLNLSKKLLVSYESETW